MSVSSTFIRRMREERERARISQTELAARMTRILGSNIDPTTVTRMEKGERTVRLDDAVAAADALGLPLGELLSSTGSERDAELRRAQYDLDNAELLLSNAVAEANRHEAVVEDLKRRIKELEEQQLAEDLNTERWPL